jgi:hypothetical protein
VNKSQIGHKPSQIIESEQAQPGTVPVSMGACYQNGGKPVARGTSRRWRRFPTRRRCKQTARRRPPPSSPQPSPSRARSPLHLLPPDCCACWTWLLQLERNAEGIYRRGKGAASGPTSHGLDFVDLALKVISRPWRLVNTDRSGQARPGRACIFFGRASVVMQSPRPNVGR